MGFLLLEGGQCDGKSMKTALVYTAKNTETSVLLKNLNGKKFDDKKNYKYQVKAYKMVDGKKIYLGSTLVYHFVGQNNKENTNPKSVTVKTSQITLKVDKSSKIKASVQEVNKKKTFILHAALVRYVSSDESVATVDKNGKVTAIKKGTCKIYCVALNGKNKAVSVTVR